MSGTDGASRHRGAPRRAVTVAVAAATVLILLGGLMWGMQRWLVYLPTGGAPPPAAEVVSGARDLRLRTGDGLELGAWLVPPRGADRGTAVLVANGNSGNRETRAPLARALADEGFTVLLFDYRGYGGNPGRPSEGGLASDARAASDALVALGHTPDRTVYLGESLGAAVLSGLAAERPPAALLLRSPFTSLADVAAHHYPFLPVRALLRDRYPVRATVARIDRPTTVVLGGQDRIVPPEQSRAVAAASPRLVEEVVVAGADHNDAALVHGPELVAALVRLADRAPGPR
ncbi:alpha/beta hydrolase [Nocardiopsis sp. FIRDI 009]|uniref:alpha/beta hydrolase n=1 Tax=Nocardiopsis sp. FIRDI 009 TaxID=714197 RepID=UPI001E37F456|nr:alpha/beta hydrolase [Nocardiopsis sp. FIRDI 009]